MMELKVVDLFCGAGGLSLGLQKAGLKPVFAADHDQHSCSTYLHNLGPHVHKLDLSEVEPDALASLVKQACGQVDVVAGGPPCQGFSVQRRGSTTDARNDLVLKFGMFAKCIAPKAIVMENVPTILGPRGKQFVDRVTFDWEQAGYTIHRAVLDASGFGVPQFRRRAFIVGIRNDLNVSFAFPKPQFSQDKLKTVRDTIEDLPPPPEDFSEHPKFPNHRRVAISKINLERIAHVPEGGGRLDVPPHLQLPCHRESNGHRHLDVFGRLWWDRPSGTLTAMFDNFTRGRFAHPEEDRNITGREGARIQSFPDSFKFLGPKKDVARQIGNAVPPLLAQAVGKALLEALTLPAPTSEQSDKRILPELEQQLF